MSLFSVKAVSIEAVMATTTDTHLHWLMLLYLIVAFHWLSSLGRYWQLASDRPLNLRWLHWPFSTLCILKYLILYELTSHLLVARIFFSISSLGNEQLLAGGSWATCEKNEETSVDDLTPCPLRIWIRMWSSAFTTTSIKHNYVFTFTITRLKHNLRARNNRSPKILLLWLLCYDELSPRTVSQINHFTPMLLLSE